MLALVLAASVLTAPVVPPLAARLDSITRAQVRAGFSGAVLVARADSVVLSGVYGRATSSAPTGAPVAFWLASDSKQFTAAAIMKLAASGRLRVTDSLSRFLAGVPSDKRGITIHQLLTHTSGLPSKYRAEGILDRDEAVRATLALRLDGASGGKFSYSNDGYVLLAAIVEIASGVPFDSYLLDSLFAPAGLRHTGLWGHERADLALAPPLDPRRLNARPATIWHDGHSVANWGFRGPGGAYSIVDDVWRWTRALRLGEVLPPAQLGTLWGHHVVVRTDSTGASYVGYGWGVRVEGGRDVAYSHVGDDDLVGHNAMIWFTPGGDAVIVLSNSGDVGDSGWSVIVMKELRKVLLASILPSP